MKFPFAPLLAGDTNALLLHCFSQEAALRRHVDRQEGVAGQQTTLRREVLRASRDVNNADYALGSLRQALDTCRNDLAKEQARLAGLEAQDRSGEAGQMKDQMDALAKEVSVAIG